MTNKNIKNLIVGVDLSPYSLKVVAEARELASKMKVPLSYVFVMQDLRELNSKFNADTLEVESYYEQAVRKKYSLKKEAKVLIIYGSPDKGILSVAKTLANPMIIVGHRGYNKLVKFFLGSTAESLVFQSPYPVWVHRGERRVLPKRILIPSDLSARSRHTFESLRNFRKVFKAESELFHVMSEPIPSLNYEMYTLAYDQIKRDNESRVKRFRKRYPELKTETALGDVTYKIRNRAKNFDVVALTPRKRKNGAGLAIGSMTSKLIHTSDKPILVVPA